MNRQKLKMVLESLIFVSEEPISLKRLVSIMDGPERDEIKEVLAELDQDLIEQNHGLRLQEVAGGYQFRSPPESAKYVSKLFEGRPQRLTKAAVETMAIVAYNQPVVRAEVERIRGVDSGGVLRTLLERDLIRIVGRQDVPGRPALYGTTEQFLEFFGLKNLSELPDMKEIIALGDAAEEHIEDEAPGREPSEEAAPEDDDVAQDEEPEPSETDEPEENDPPADTDDEENPSGDEPVEDAPDNNAEDSEEPQE